jgi:hypothetical protein
VLVEEQAALMVQAAVGQLQLVSLVVMLVLLVLLASL